MLAFSTYNVKKDIAVTLQWIVEQVSILRGFISAVFLVVGVVWSLVAEYQSCGAQCRRRRRRALERVLKFSEESGIKEELNHGLLKFPSVFLNVFLLMRMHHEQSVELLKNNKHVLKPKSAISQPLTEHEIEEALRMNRYCQTVYGAFVVNANVAARKRSSRRRSLFFNPVKNSLDSLKRYNRLRSVEVLVKSKANDLKYTKHLLFLDHQRHEAVLTIRGSFSVADILVDIDCLQTKFCGGYAPNGMATMANNIWEKSAGHLLHEVPPDYKLVIVGHSLGGAIANLLTIKIVSGNLLPHHRKIECHAFGAPPTFVGNMEVVAKVRPHIINYVHRDDAVPFLQLSTVRRLNTAIAAIDQERSKLSWSQWFFTLTGCQNSFPSYRANCESAHYRISARLQEELSSKAPTDFRQELIWPSQKIVWLVDNGQNTYQAVDCNAEKLTSLRGLLMSASMMTDHDLGAYEDAIRAVCHSGPQCTISSDYSQF